MRLIIDNTKIECVIGGKDNLLPINVSKELYDYFSVRKPNQHFRKKKPVWDDGYQHFYSKKNILATGYLPLLIALCDELGVDITHIEDHRRNMPQFVPKAERDWMVGGKWESRENQQIGVNAFMDNYLTYGLNKDKTIYFPRGIEWLATNAGKTSVIFSMIKNCISPRVFILIDNEVLQDQLYNFLKDHYDVGLIRSKSKGRPAKYEIRDITIGMVKTVKAALNKSINVEHDLATKFDMLIVDECHKSSGKEYSDVIVRCDAGARAFLSGTALDSDNDLARMVIVGMSGAVLHKISKKELMDAGYSLPVKVFMHLHRPSIPSFYDYPTAADLAIHENVVRTEMIGELIDERPDKKILVAFEFTHHGRFMYEHLKKVYKFSKMTWTYGGDPDRLEKLEQFKRGEIEIMIASRIFSTGIDMPDINVLIYAKGGMSVIELSQWSGRTERHDGVSENAELHDFYDDTKYLDVHSKKRIKFYEREQFEIDYRYERYRNRPTTPKDKNTP